VHDGCAVDTAGELAGFRRELHRCLTARTDALFELTDALLCNDGPVKSLVRLTLAREHRSMTPAQSMAASTTRAETPVPATRSSPFRDPPQLPGPHAQVKIISAASGHRVTPTRALLCVVPGRLRAVAAAGHGAPAAAAVLRGVEEAQDARLVGALADPARPPDEQGEVVVDGEPCGQPRGVVHFDGVRRAVRGRGPADAAVPQDGVETLGGTGAGTADDGLGKGVTSLQQCGERGLVRLCAASQIVAGQPDLQAARPGEQVVGRGDAAPTRVEEVDRERFTEKGAGVGRYGHTVESNRSDALKELPRNPLTSTVTCNG
jgi:hypothetical protein